MDYEIKLVPYEQKHYEILVSWWNHYKFPQVHYHFLPKHGFIVEIGDKMLCAGFLYRTDSPIAILEWIVGNPNVSKDLRKIGLKFLINEITKKSEELKFRAIFTSVHHNGLMDRLLENDFKKTDEGMTNFFWIKEG